MKKKNCWEVHFCPTTWVNKFSRRQKHNYDNIMDSQIVLFMKNSKIINGADNIKEIKICSYKVL